MLHSKESKYSSEVEDAINEHPTWMMDWGIASILSVLVLLLLGSYLYKYPDIISADVTINTQNPTISMVGKVDGRIERMLVKDGQKVKTNDILILIENPADYNDIQKLKSYLNHVKNYLLYPQSPFHFKLDDNISLGPLQEDYSSFLEEFDYYLIISKSNYFINKVAASKLQIELQNLNLENLIIQNSILAKELGLAEKQVIRDSTLYFSKVISKSDFENANSVYLQKLYSFQRAETNLINLKIEIEQAKELLLDLEENQKIKIEAIERSLKKKILNLLSQISLWENLFVIKSPIEGYVSFNRFYASGLHTVAGEKIINIIPIDSTLVFARAETSLKNTGKLKIGQQVNIKLENYPFSEYGSLKGSLTNISKMPENKIYYLNIKLDKEIKTTREKKIQLSQGMSGKAEIITNDKRLIERIADPIISLLNR